MPAPRVFISSTCYDLKYIRENLRFFIRSLGYEPVLSEDGAIFYDPTLHVADACIAEVPICQKVNLYDYLLKQDVVHDLVAWKIDPSPGLFLKHKTLDELCDNRIEPDETDESYSLTYGGPPYAASKSRVESNQKKYLAVRSELINRLKAAEVSEKEFLQET